MIQNQVVSISELRKNTKKYINLVEETKKPQYILINNKPRVMIVDLEYWHEWLWIYDKNGVEYAIPYPNETEAINQHEVDKKNWENLWTEWFSFLNSLLK